jgi:hypothetical protein
VAAVLSSPWLKDASVYHSFHWEIPGFATLFRNSASPKIQNHHLLLGQATQYWRTPEATSWQHVTTLGIILHQLYLEQSGRMSRRCAQCRLLNPVYLPGVVSWYCPVMFSAWGNPDGKESFLQRLSLYYVESLPEHCSTFELLCLVRSWAETTSLPLSVTAHSGSQTLGTDFPCSGMLPQIVKA